MPTSTLVGYNKLLGRWSSFAVSNKYTIGIEVNKNMTPNQYSIFELPSNLKRKIKSLVIKII